MTALLLCGIVVCGIVALVDVAGLVGGDDGVSGMGFLNLIPLIFAIVILSICLGQL